MAGRTSTALQRRQGTVAAAFWPIVAALMLAWVPTGAIAQYNMAQCDSLGGETDLAYNAVTQELTVKSSGKPVRHDARKVRLRLYTGYCISDSKRYPFRQEVFGLTVVAEHDKGKVERKFRCTIMDYKTPSGVSCDRVVYKEKWNNSDEKTQALFK